MTLQKLVVFELAFPDANGIQGRLWGGFGEALGRLWEALGGFAKAWGGFGSFWSFEINLGATFGRLWETLGEPLGRLWGALGSFGRRWGSLWEVFGRLCGSFGSLSEPFFSSRLLSLPYILIYYKLPINRFSGPILTFIL